MCKEKTFEEIEQENYDKMLDAMVTHNQATDSTLTFNTDKEREQYKQELSASLDKLSEAETKEEIEKVLEENQDNEVFNAAASFTATQMKPEEYVVRGALLKCSHGSHHRRLNLPKCHGVYIGQNPVMHSGDCKAGIDAMVEHDINITSFGVCDGINSKPTDTDQNISLAKEVLDQYGHPIPGEVSDGVVRGVQCKACIQNSTWENAHKSTKIGEGGEYAITTNSFLVCQHGGVIMAVTSGQETVIDQDIVQGTIDNAEKFIEIIDNGGSVHYGGDQDWFGSLNGGRAKDGGCGTVAATNIFAYMSSINPKYRNLYVGTDFSQEQFTKAMEDVYNYVTPYNLPDNITGITTLGIWPVSKFESQVEKYANAKGVELRGVKPLQYPSTKEAAKYIREGLKKGLPVTVMVGVNDDLTKVDIYNVDGTYAYTYTINRHWMTITEMTVDKTTGKTTVKLQTWGKYAYVDLDTIINGEKLYNSFIYFE